MTLNSTVSTTGLGKYTVLTHDGLSSNPYPEPPSRANTADTLAAARELFRTWLGNSGNDYTRADGYGQPWADIVPTSAWDGTSYGDTTGGDGIERLTRGPRGGIVRDNF
jgi:hypothetical protein